MRYFPVLDFQYMAAAIFLGLAAFILVYVAWGSYLQRRQALGDVDRCDASGDNAPKADDVAKHPVFPFLIFIYVGIACWCLAYVIFVGILGGPVGF